MKKFYLLFLLSALATTGFGQTTRWQQHADSIFQYIDRSQVSTGLLTNYGFALKDYNQFQGTALTASNQLQNLAEWRLLYTALQTSVFNGNATLPSLVTANQSIAQARQQAPGVVNIATLLARYDRFRDDAGTAGLVTVSNQQLYDNPNRTSSPYEQRTLIALCPLQTGLTTRTPQFSFPSQLRFTNAAPTITALEFDAGDGLGYRAAAWDQPIGASYAADGTYTLRFRLTCADGTVLLSQARLNVKQVAAARYGNNGVVTRHSSTLFNDTRAYNGAAAAGTVTVAYANGNTTGTIRKPLIVIEGYDPSHALNNPNQNYSYNNFATGTTFGGISTRYISSNPNDRTIFNDQLSEVGQYDLIFLDYDNGTDYIQRNAYLVERLIQWVNDNKQPLNGVNQPNIVMGMSMGGLVARYALRDMEVRRLSNPGLPAHDTRLYISHEAPHQGANVPLGFQYMVKSVANIQLVPGLTLGKLNPELGDFASLLDEPATQQLLIYQTNSNGDAVHQAWLNEYNQLGYPQQCRNVATSDGSECGRPQDFAPYAQLLNIQGNGLLDHNYNDYANAGIFLFGTVLGSALLPFLGPAGFLVPYTVGLIFSLGNFEGHVDFVVNALPSQQQQRIYHGRFSICKDILFGLFSTCLLDYADDSNSSASMLAYDSAPGGLYDINQVSGNALSQIGPSLPVAGTQVSIHPTFCFVPTTSALDIGGGNTALAPQDLTAAYANTSLPTGALATPFANFITASRENLTHILWNGLNSKWAFQEMQQTPQNFDCQAFCQVVPVISGSGTLCDGNTQTYTVNAPATTSVVWDVQPAGLVPYTTSGNTITITKPAGSSNGRITVAATIVGDCGQLAVPAISIALGTPARPIASMVDTGTCNDVANYHIENYDPTQTYTITNRYYASGSYRSSADFYVKGGSGIQSGSFTLNATNACGTSSARYSVSYPQCAGFATAYTLSPNPATDEVLVQPVPADHAPGNPAAPAGIALVRVYDNYGRLRLEQPGHGAASLRLRVHTLPAGSYVVHVLHGTNVVSRQRLQLNP